MRFALSLLLTALLAAAGRGAPAAGPAPPPALDEPRAVPAVLHTPASGIAAAHDDAQALLRLGKDLRYYRWLSSYNAATRRELDDLAVEASFVAAGLNFFSSNRGPLAKLADGRLLRVDLDFLGIDPKVFDQLGALGSGPEAFPEPYFHQQLVALQVEQVRKTRTVWKTWPGGADRAGTYFPAGYRYRVEEEYTEEVKKAGGNKLVIAPWTDLKKYTTLVALTGSQFPVLRTDWFVVYALQEPFYSKVQKNPKNFADVLKLAGIDKKVFDVQGTLLRGAPVRSEVARHNRAIERAPSQFDRGRGSFLQTFDFNKSIAADDVIANQATRDRDAGEIIWTKPDGTNGYQIVVKQGKDEVTAIDANPDVALDQRTYLQDVVVHNGFKCVFCHAQGPLLVKDEVRRHGAVQIADPKVAAFVQDTYFGDDLNRLLLADQDEYARAVKAVTGGVAPAAVALQFQARHYTYWYRAVSLADIAVETGYPLDAVKFVVQEATKPGSSGIDQTFTRALKGGEGRRDQFEASFSQLVTLLLLVPEKKS